MTLPAGTVPASGILARLQYPLLAGILLILLILGWRGREPVNITTTDENTYVALSKSLQAGSYREIYLGSAPLHVKYPPGYPAFILGLRLIGGENLDLIRAANLVLLATSVLFMFLIVRRVAGVGVALAVAFLLAINHSLLNVGGSLLSECFFVCLGAAALWSTLRTDDQPQRHGYWAIALALAAFLARTAGVTLVVAVGLWLLRRRRRGELVAYAVGALLVVGGWFAYTALVPAHAGGESYGNDIVDGLTRRSNASPLLRPVYSLLRNLGHYGVRTLPTGLGVPTIPGTTIDNVAWLAVLSVLLVVGIVVLWKRARAVSAYILTYGGLLLAWPWLQARLMVPFIPLVLMAVIVGANSLTRTLPAAARHGFLAVLLLLLGFGGARATLQRDALAQKCDLANPYYSEGCFNPVTRGVGKASQYLREHSPPDAVVLTAEGAGVNYASGRLTELPLIFVGVPKEQTLQRMRDLKVGYVLLSGKTSGMVGMARKLYPFCTQFWIERRFDLRVILLTTQPADATSENSCAVLQELTTPLAKVQEQ